MEERLNKLETLITMQDRTINELNHEIYQQHKTITALKRRVDDLEDRLEQMKQQGGSDPITNERPPHY